MRPRLSKSPARSLRDTRFLNDLINRIIDQFTSFPILVAALALFTGGVVIANSVALSTLERRREIGIMKAVGLQRERVLGMLLLENGLMGLVGGLIGVGISFIALVLMLAQMFAGELGDAIPYSTAFTLMGLCIGTRWWPRAERVGRVRREAAQLLPTIVLHNTGNPTGPRGPGF